MTSLPITYFPHTKRPRFVMSNELHCRYNLPINHFITPSFLYSLYLWKNTNYEQLWLKSMDRTCGLTIYQKITGCISALNYVEKKKKKTKRSMGWGNILQWLQWIAGRHASFVTSINQLPRYSRVNELEIRGGQPRFSWVRGWIKEW